MGQKLERISLYLLAALYIGAGCLHFAIPGFYRGIIPPYIPAARELVYLSGLAEVLLGILVLFRRTRKLACTGIIVLLLGFLPVHIYLIQTAGQAAHISATFAWLRIPIQGLFIYWAAYHRKRTG